MLRYAFSVWCINLNAHTSSAMESILQTEWH